MKKTFLHSPIIIILLIGLFLLTEGIWIMYLHKTEEKNFQNNINQAIQSASNEEAYAIKEKEPAYFLDLRKEGRMIIEYTLRGKHFRTDTTRKEVTTLLNRMLYDFYKASWNLEHVVNHFHHFNPAPELSIIFIRKDADGEIIDQYPSEVIPQDPSIFPPQQLGNTETDHLLAWYDFPFIYFWESQKYGLLLSLLSLILVLYYGILILKKENKERKNLGFIEKQIIFIHDLKTPLCTNRDIENRILKNIENWPPEKIHEKIEISRHQSDHLLKEMHQINIQSASRWGGEIENQIFNLKKALEELINNQQYVHEKAHISLDFQLENPEIFADPFHLVHIVENLISNALKYAGEEANIHIICSKDHQNKLLISVKDNGPGIPKHFHKRIFRLGVHSNFHNVNSHGLGLAYIRKIVRQYKGCIRIKSKMNEGTEFCLVFNLSNHTHTPKNISSAHIYRYFFITLLLAEIIWLFDIYSAERTNFVNDEEVSINEAVSKITKTLFKWQDTACFENNWKEKTITITRGLKDTTVAMGGGVNQRYIYRRSFYDLRDSRWSLDSIGQYYQKTATPHPTFFIRRDATGKIIDHYPAENPNIFLPAVFYMPLGYVEGHQLEVQLSYPWTQPLKTHKAWLIIAFLATLLSGWFTWHLVSLTHRQQAMIRFQREKVQHFIRELQIQLQHLQQHETAILYSESYKTKPYFQQLNGNISQYENMLHKINYLLDKLTILKTHPMILTSDYEY